ncbi:hypothetical protein [Pseudactinotalea sp. Z1748]
MPTTATATAGAFWSNAHTDHPEATAMLLDLLLNDPDAVVIIRDDRGL